MNLPNLLTASRLIGIPIVTGLLLARFPYHDQWAAVAFAVFSLTDTLDGQLARRFGQVTEMGKFLDPLADKLFILSVLVILVQERLLPAWVVVVIFARELMITLLRSVGLGQGRVIAASGWGKTKTVTQTAAVILVVLARPYPWLEPYALFGVAVALVVTIGSGLDYLWRFRHVIVLPSPRERVVTPLPAAGAAPSEVDLAAKLGDRLVEAGWTLGTAESCTGGMLAGTITAVAGSSRYFAGGIVSYSDELKRRLLEVPAELLTRHGAVSAEVAIAMAQAARERLGVDLAIAVTGIAGPGSDGSDKRVGLTFIAVADPESARVNRYEWKGDRSENRRLSVEAALQMALAAVVREAGAKEA